MDGHVDSILQDPSGYNRGSTEKGEKGTFFNLLKSTLYTEMVTGLELQAWHHNTNKHLACGSVIGHLHDLDLL